MHPIRDKLADSSPPKVGRRFFLPKMRSKYFFMPKAIAEGTFFVAHHEELILIILLFLIFFLLTSLWSDFRHLPTSWWLDFRHPHTSHPPVSGRILTS
jgi:hypothetical protein